MSDQGNDPGNDKAMRLVGRAGSYNKFSSQTKNNTSGGDMAQEKWARQLSQVRHLARAGQIGAELLGSPELARELGELSGAAGGALDEGAKAGPGGARRASSNFLGKKVADRAAGKGIAGKKLSAGKSQALGGAVAAALQGENPVDMAKNAFSWWIASVVFGSLLTVVWFIPSLLYLDFHYLMSKMGSKIFGEMFISQKILLLVANLFFFLALIIVGGLLAYIYDQPNDACKTFGSVINPVISLMGYVGLCGTLKKVLGG